MKIVGTLYDLLKYWVTKKRYTDTANVNQLGFIINLMPGYNKDDLFDKKYTHEKTFFGKMKP